MLGLCKTRTLLSCLHRNFSVTRLDFLIARQFESMAKVKKFPVTPSPFY
jgi:hypothetical protein